MDFSEFQKSKKELNESETFDQLGFVRPNSTNNYCYIYEGRHYLIAKIDGLFEYGWGKDGIDVAESLWEAEDGLFEKLAGKSVES